MDNWISVQDRLPEQADDVLVYTSDEYFMMGEYEHGKWKIYPHPYLRPSGAVSHWMPLPEPPKTDNQ